MQKNCRQHRVGKKGRQMAWEQNRCTGAKYIFSLLHSRQGLVLCLEYLRATFPHVPLGTPSSSERGPFKPPARFHLWYSRSLSIARDGFWIIHQLWSATPQNKTNNSTHLTAELWSSKSSLWAQGQRRANVAELKQGKAEPRFLLRGSKGSLKRRQGSQLTASCSLGNTSYLCLWDCWVCALLLGL